MTCINSRDTITQADGHPLDNHYDYPDINHIVTSHCRTADGTWIAWINGGLGDATGAGDIGPTGDTNKADWPSRIASSYAVSVGFFADDGSAPVVYDLGVDPVYSWTQGSTGRGETLCGYWFVVGDVYELWGKAILTGWSMNALDVQVRTDGTNVWVAVLAQESVEYPFLSTVEHTDRCGNSHPSMLELWGERGSDAFAHDWDAGSYFWFYGSGFGGGPSTLFPGVAYDDAGDSRSLRWSPARLTVFAGDLGGFTLIDHVEADFNNYDATGGLVSGIEAAASPAEPGVLHVLWAEGGKFGTQGVDERRGQRINYTRWDTSGKTLDTDLFYETTTGYNTNQTDDPQDLYMPDGQFVFTAEMILRNDHGSPIAIVWPYETSAHPSSIAQFWDLSVGTVNVVQTVDPSLVPTSDEGMPDGGVLSGVLPHDPDPLLDGPPRRSQFASSLYTDPTLTNHDVYLICANYTDLAAFYRIPCDGSATFDFMDGRRQAGYSIVNNTPNPQFDEMDNFNADFVSDPDNVWIPAENVTSGAVTGGALMHLTRRCQPLWELLPAFPVPDPATGYESGDWGLVPGVLSNGTSPPAIVTDSDGDWVAGAGTGPILTTDSSSPTNIAALRAKICRCCVPCATGLHLWQVI